MGNLFTFLPNYSASFHGSATFRNDKTHFHYMFLLPPTSEKILIL